MKTAIATVHVIKVLDERIFKKGGSPALPTLVPYTKVLKPSAVSIMLYTADMKDNWDTVATSRSKLHSGISRSFTSKESPHFSSLRLTDRMMMNKCQP